MKKILVPTDFSNQAYNATKAAAIIARKMNAEIILLHILDLPQQGSDSINKGTPATEVMFFKKAADAKLEELAHDPIFNGITISSSLILDRTSLGVTKSAENNKVNLIVMGSHGVSGVKEYFVGSNTEKVVRTSNIPVLVIKGEVEDFEIKDFVFASDFSEGMTEPFKKALNFNKILGSKFHLLMVNTPNNFKPTHVAEEIVEKFLDTLTDKEFDLCTYNDMNIEKGIINFSKKIDADLIGIATHGRTGLAHFFNGSISEDLVNHSSKSVITFKID
ncbi:MULTISPECIES: universal stress protein [Myroides]|uniref:Universal stress protein n=1 Tax=Myroides albus TaxID=2562892 RepID=A0A6I3LKN6_9FLAO|nr:MULTISPECIES: universal stress protein [Myroides]MTG96732.1 universal stress protein [Myroides albus]MVX35626.1 universal stress protein [Myroides sp. LoEW2-1]UVD80856.1 universal stress protein [Myroides albus]